MKIGAGGLQPYVLHDVLKNIDLSQKPKAGVQETLLQAQGRDLNMLKEELNRAVEHLNQMANALNYPIQITLKEPPPRLKITVKDKGTGEEKELTLEELAQLAKRLEGNRGTNLDSYA
ncbi:flagellar protein FlaG [Desulforamulus ruminis]|nr:flagellar protein FlaG [Desulforamulus ruminis]